MRSFANVKTEKTVIKKVVNSLVEWGTIDENILTAEEALGLISIIKELKKTPVKERQRIG